MGKKRTPPPPKKKKKHFWNVNALQYHDSFSFVVGTYEQKEPGKHIIIKQESIGIYKGSSVCEESNEVTIKVNFLHALICFSHLPMNDLPNKKRLQKQLHTKTMCYLTVN